MIGRSKDMTAETTAKDAPRGTSRRVIPTVTALSIGFALVAGWSVSSGSAGCAGPVVIDPIRDFGSGDMVPDGAMTTSTRFSGAPSTMGALLSDIPPLPDFQRWKRDPNYALDGTDHYMFYAGSDYGTELWTLAVFKATGSGNPSWPGAATQVLRGVAGGWDSRDLTAPTVRISSAGSPKFVLYYAGNGDPAKPDFVTQIGRATSTDGMTWTRSGSTPALAVPAFTGTTANDTPTTPRPDAYGATDPAILVEGSSVILYYAGLDCTAGAAGTCTYKIYRSVSTDGGMTFPAGEAVQLGTIPDAPGGVAGPSIVSNAGLYILTYTAVKDPVAKSRIGVRQALTRGSIGIATGTDGKNFSYAGGSAQSPVPLISRGGGNYSEGASAPSLYTSGTSLKLYFGGLSEQGGTYFNILPADVNEIK
jgi:hypothetical protein